MAIANYTTSKAVEETAADIITALRRRGITRISTVYDDGGDPSGLEFTMRTEYGPRDFALPIRTAGVLEALKRAEAAGEFAASRKKAGTFTTPVHAARVAWAIARDWLRAQSALLDAELVTLDEVMFPWMVGGADGQTAFSAYRSQQKAIES
ncbi:hypothetical protein [Microbacterium sp. Ag1]|uniref:hypothetical protein n=1 Tax=Microbacterium sp. Ag1 TaxID=1643443 RepID=UPI0006293B6E|nr:hypothetical protein [Microbacterium sp. Ag1]KKX97717.1 hypothetical protein AAY78_11010 [Microbacterium sp. Ag1]